MLVLGSWANPALSTFKAHVKNGTKLGFDAGFNLCFFLFIFPTCSWENLHNA